MSQFSKLESDHRPPNTSKNLVTGTIAWIVIALCVVAIFIGSRREKQAQAAPADVFKVSTEFDLTAASLLGTRSMSKASVTADTAEAQLGKLAKTDGEQIALAIVMRELGDKQKAEELLKLAEAKGSEQKRIVDSTRRLFEGTENDFDLAVVDEKIGWFGNVAAAQTRLPDDLLRERFEARNRRVAFANIGLFVLLVGAGLAGLGLFITGVVLWSKGKLTWAGLGDVTPSAPFVEAFALYLALFTAIGVVMDRAVTSANSPGVMIAVLGGMMMLVVAAIYWTKLRGVPQETMRQAYGAHPGRGALKEALMGIVGYLALLPILMLGLGITLLLKNATSENPSHPIQEMMGGKIEMVILAFFLGVVLAPVSEEFMFRGALFAHLRKWMPWGAAGAVVAIIFALVHPQGAIAVPVLACIGFNLAVIRFWRGSSIANITAHAINNAVALSFITLISQ